MRNTRIDDRSLVQAAQQYGTPCLCYEQKEIEHWARTLRSALPDAAEIIYSVKASPSPALITYYRQTGFFFETASDGELTALLALEVSPDKIWVSGQGKTEAYLKNAVFHGVRRFNLESPHELAVLAPLISGKKGYSCNLRVNPKHSFGESVLAAAGRASAFGVDEEQMSDVLLGEYGDLIDGIFLYAGSQIFCAEDIVKNTEYCLDLCRKFYEITGRKLKNVDFGGGFGVPEDECTPELDMAKLRAGLDDVFQRFAREPAFSDSMAFYFESGRYLAARTACLLTSILDVKSSRGQKYAIIDGGINYLGVKQQEYRLYPPYIRHIGRGGGEKSVYQIVGTTCTPIDLVHPGAMLCSPQIGDYISIPDCGAYSLTFSPQSFNGLYAVPELLHRGGRWTSLVKRGDFKTPFGEAEYVPVRTGHEITDVLAVSCPKESDEVQNIAAAAQALLLNGFGCMIYDTSSDGTEAVILLKILKAHYQIAPAAVFSDFNEISRYTGAPCYPCEAFPEWSEARGCGTLFAMLTGSPYAENDVSAAIALIFEAGIRNFMKIESELIASMEYDFYSFFLHHTAQLQESFDLMADLTSARCFIEYMRTVLENDFWRLEQSPLSAKYWGYDTTPRQAFYRHLEDEAWLNIGACNGDTIFRFLRNQYGFSHIHAVDTDSNALVRCKANLKLLTDHTILERISFYNNDLGCCANQVRIDDLFQSTRISLINMDVEGAENNVILSAAGLIRRERPVLAICAYHRPEDLAILSQTIYSIVSDYAFYLRKYPSYPYHRYNSKEELVLYAIPPERMI